MKYNYEKILNDIDNKHIRLGQEIEDYKYCLTQLNILTSLISTCNIKCSGFSEILCNID